MTLRLEDISSASDRLWDATWRRAPAATGYHSRWWAEAWERATRGRIRPAPQLVRFSDGRSAVLPLSRQRRRALCSRTLSSPAGTIGGWIADTPLDRDHAELLAAWLLDRAPLAWRVNPFDERQSDLALPAATVETTHALPLGEGETGLERRWKAGGGATMRKARKAARSGVRVRHAEGESDWRAYDLVYRMSLARWGERATSRYDWAVLDALRRMPRDVRTLWLAVRDEQVVAGALCVYGPRVASYWHGAADAEHFALRPVNLLMGEIVRDACRRGLAWFDFGPSGPHEGVAAFKRSFGATALPAPIVRRPAARLPFLPRYRAAA